MKKINSSGQSFFQGWNDSLASPEERPGMRSVFTYDFWIDSTEITQKQYFELIGKNPVPENGQNGVGNQFPVCFVTWFDAVLFCNARSRADGLDTVYRYTDKYAMPGGGCVYDLTDLQCDLSKDGYRLPTETEWEFAARGASTALPFSSSSDIAYAQNVAWFGANSFGKARPVATKAPNFLGIYDLAGNVFEWTNDWKGIYKGTTVINPLGLFQTYNNFEKIVKGGSYNYGMTYLRPSYRSSPFSTTAYSSNEFIGFRCARAAIPGGHYIDMPDSLQVNFALDSFGLYDDPVGEEAQQDFAIKMNLFWKLHNQLDMVFIGDATLYCGIDCSVFTHYKALNMGFNACGISCISAVFNNYLSAHAPKLKLIGIYVPFYFEPLLSNAETTIGKSKGYKYDESHGFWKGGIPVGFDEIILKQPSPSGYNNWWDSLGMRLWGCSGWRDSAPQLMFAQNWYIDDSSYLARFAAFKKLIQEISARNIHLLVINFPQSPHFRNTPYYSRFGPDRETGRAVIAQLKALESIYPFFHVYDANCDGNHDYTDDEATDYDRLCPVGAAKLTGRINTLIDSIMAR
jgi:formylglycine-generating enzyme required for sulfatase activity